MCTIVVGVGVISGLAVFGYMYGDSWWNTAGTNDAWKSATSIYEFNATDIDGNEVSLEKYRGHVAIIVNVASK